jgi:hypothetical protein
MNVGYNYNISQSQKGMVPFNLFIYFLKKVS